MEVNTEPFRALRIGNLDPEATDEAITDGLLEKMKDFKFVSVKVLCKPGEDRAAFTVFRYVEDAAAAFAMHRDMVLCDKLVDVSVIPLNNTVMDVLPTGDKPQGLRQKEIKYPVRGRRNERGYRHGGGFGRGRGGYRESYTHHSAYSKKLGGKLRLPSRHLFIGGIPSCTSEQDLKQIFEQYGIVMNVDRKPAYAFVKFFSLDMALHAKKALNGKIIDGEVCQIGFGTSSPRSCIWVGKLGSWTDETEIVTEFSQFGKIDRFVWPQGKNFAYVLFERMRDAREAYEKMQGFQLGRSGKKILIDYADHEQIDSPLNYEPSTTHANNISDCDDESDWKSDHSYPEEDVNFEESLYDHEPHSPRFYRKERSRDRSVEDELQWQGSPVHDKGRHFDYPTHGKSNWRNRGREHNRRDDWRNYNLNDGRSRGLEYEIGRGDRHCVGDDRRDYKRAHDGNYKSDDQRSYERNDRRNYEKRSYGRDDQRSYEKHDHKSYDRHDRRSQEHNHQRSGKRDRSASSYEARRRSRSSEDDHFKRSKQSTREISDRDFQNFEMERSRRSIEIDSGLRNAGIAIPLPNPMVSSKKLPFFSPAGTLPLSNPMYPQNPATVFPQTNVVPIYQSSFQEPLTYSSSLNVYPPASQPLPDFSVPPPVITSYSGVSNNPAYGGFVGDLGGVKQDIMSRFPVVWSGAVVLKNSAFVTNMYLVSGSVLLVDTLLRDQSTDCPALKITQRLRLDEPEKLKEVDRRVSMSGRNGCSILLAVPASAEIGDVNNVIQQRPLSSLGSYLREKAVAAVILLPPGCVPGSQTGILHAFPPCEFAYDFLRREAPELAKDYPKDDHLLIIIMRESGESSAA